MRDAVGQPLELGDNVVFVWEGGNLARGFVTRPGPSADKYKSRPNSGYIYVETTQGKRTWKYFTQVAKIPLDTDYGDVLQ